jgi:hypothetical protein
MLSGDIQLASSGHPQGIYEQQSLRRNWINHGARHNNGRHCRVRRRQQRQHGASYLVSTRRRWFQK